MVFRRLLTVIVLIAIAWLLVKFQDRASPSVQDFGAQKEIREDIDVGISFAYPNGYVLQEHMRGPQDHPDFIKAFILMRQEDYDILATLEGTEGPPSISILVFNNPSGLMASLWMQEPTIAPYIPPQATTPTTTTVGGKEGVAFGADGLYQNDNVIVGSGDRMFYFSVSYNDTASPMRSIFQNIVASVEFVK